MPGLDPSTAFRAPVVKRAVLAGMSECLTPLKVLVFPGSPEGNYKSTGSAWVSSLKSKPEIVALGAENNTDEDVTVVVSASAYFEAESHMAAYTAAEDRVNEILGAYRDWLRDHQTLENTCEWFAIGEIEWRAGASDKGWVVDGDFPITAHLEPPTP